MRAGQAVPDAAGDWRREWRYVFGVVFGVVSGGMFGCSIWRGCASAAACVLDQQSASGSTGSTARAVSDGSVGCRALEAERDSQSSNVFSTASMI